MQQASNATPDDKNRAVLELLEAVEYLTAPAIAVNCSDTFSDHTDAQAALKRLEAEGLIQVTFYSEWRLWTLAD